MKIEIQEETRKILQKKLEETSEFKDLEEYINYILSQVANKLESKENPNNNEKEEIKKRLTSLGYSV